MRILEIICQKFQEEEGEYACKIVKFEFTGLKFPISTYD